MVVLKQRKGDKEACPLYEDHMQLKSYAEENRNMIQGNHIEIMKIIGNMKESNTAELSKIVSNIGETNKKFDTLNATIERAARVFSWWDSLPEKRQKITKLLSTIVALMAGITVVITFFEKITGL